MRLLLTLLIASTCLGQGLSLRSPAFLVTQSITATATVPGIFVDSVGGSDSNAGTSNAPYASLAKVTSVLGAGSTVATNIYLKRGSTFREAWIPLTNVTVDCYGTVATAPAIYGGVVNSKPVITGAEMLTNANFSLLDGKTNCWAYSLDVPVFTNSYASLVTSNVLMVWENNVRLGALWSSNAGAGGTNSVEGGTNRFYYDAVAKILYIAPSDFSSPVTNGRTYEASIRTLALHGGESNVVSNLICEKSYAYNTTGGQGYGIFAYGSGRYYKCVGRYGWNHNVGVANSVISSPLTFEACYGMDMETAGTVFVGYKDNTNTVSQVVFTNCLASQSAVNAGIGTGFYSHDLASAHPGVNAQFRNCVARWVATGFSSNGRCDNVDDNTAYQCKDAGIEAWGSMAINNFTNYYHTGTGKGIVIANAWTIPINNCKFIFTNNSTGIYCSNTNALVTVTNTVFACTGTRSGYGFQGTGGIAGTDYHSVSNVFSNVSIGYLNGTMRSGVDYNNYYNLQYIGDLEGGGNPAPGYWTGAQFATWQTVWAPLDANSVQTNPGYAAGYYTFTVTDPTGGDGN